MSAQHRTDLPERSVLRATVSVGGRRWCRLPNVEALRAAASDSPVYILDTATDIVRFGDGVHGARPPTGALVRVRYRQGGGVAGNVVVCWEGRWPPRPIRARQVYGPQLFDNAVNWTPGKRPWRCAVA